MAYTTNDIRGNFLETLDFHNEIGGDDLYQKFKGIILKDIESGYISANSREDVLKSGGIFGSKAPLFILSNTNPENYFFDMGICVNGKTVSFLLLGESRENTKNNKKNYYLENGNKIKAALVKVDELKLQQEAAWQQTIINSISQYID